ncbi:DUF7594 domain-containing protein [Actinoplanes campanulatus]|uniref:CBM96 family carbohydrate-binding protein n=2 Tax=Actinoplanes campanulatus TaxID=113559 RepID=UPI0031D580B5
MASIAINPLLPDAALATPEAKAKPACPAYLDTEEAALTTARLCDGPVRIEGLTTQTDTAVAKPDGTVEWKHNYRPVRVHSGDNWVPADATLRKLPSGRVTPRAAALDVSFSGGGDDAMVTVRDGSSIISFDSPVGTLPVPSLAETTATYTEVLPGVDLQLHADVEGFSQVFVVKNAEAAKNAELRRIRFGLLQKSMKLKADKSGNLRVSDAKGNVLLVGSAPQMWDAPRQKTQNGAPAKEGGRFKVIAPIVTDSAIVVTPDAAMLADPETQYPIYIDPGLTVNRTSWSLVDSAVPTTANWNSVSEAQVGTTDGGTTKRRSFFNFGLGSTAVAGKYVVGATLELNETYSASCTARQVDLYSTTAATATTTWNAQPTWGAIQSSATAAKGYSSSCPAGPLTMDATAAVRSAASSSSTVTLGLRSPNETDNSYFKRFSNNPTLTISYTAYPTVLSPFTEPSTPCVTGTNRGYLNTTTPVLQARITDPEGASVRPEFAWSTAAGTAIEPFSS